MAGDICGATGTPLNDLLPSYQTAEMQAAALEASTTNLRTNTMPFDHPAFNGVKAAVIRESHATEQNVHPDDAAVDALAAKMKAKLAKQRAKGYGGWDTFECTQQRLSDMLRDHVAKGDPVDVANFCAFLNARDEGIAQEGGAA